MLEAWWVVEPMGLVKVGGCFIFHYLSIGINHLGCMALGVIILKTLPNSDILA